MSTEPQSYRCDLSGRSFPSRSNVRGGLALDLGADSRLYVWSRVSAEAAAEILSFIAERFPENSPAVREAHIPPPEEPSILTAQQLADEEENALERAREEGGLIYGLPQDRDPRQPY